MSSSYRLPPGIDAREGDYVKLASDSYNQLVFQDARVFRTGNSLAIRIPSAIAKNIDLQEGSPVDMGVDNGLIWIRRSPSRSLTELIDRITPENVHGEEFADIEGSERW